MYAKKYFDIDYLKKVDLQNGVGVYYTTQADNIKEEFYSYFDIDNNNITDYVTLTSEDFKTVKDTSLIDYDYTDMDEIECFLGDLMNYKKYTHYLIVVFGATWTRASGYKFSNSYLDTFCRDYDTTMYYENGTKGGKAITLKEYSHDCPMGYNSVIVGLTEAEYYSLKDKEVKTIINFGRKYLKNEEESIPLF